MAREFAHSRTAESLAYPLAGGTLGLVFATSLVRGLRLAQHRTGQRGVRQTTARPAPLGPLWSSSPSKLDYRSPSCGAIRRSATRRCTSGRGGWRSLAWLQYGHLLPVFNTYFWGAPQIYPPLGAAMDDIAGLAGARLLSLVFMLITTALLYLTSKRLFDQRTAYVAAALWVTCEAAIKLGAFATYDWTSAPLLSASAWVAVEAGYRRRHGELIGVAAVLMALGDVTAYSYTLYDPVVLAVAILAWWPRRGLQRAAISAAWMTGCLLVLVILLPTGLHLWPGIVVTVLARAHGTNTVTAVAEESWSLIGIMAALALAGVMVAVATKQARSRVWLLAVLTAAVVLVPAEQAHIHTMVNIDKHLSLRCLVRCLGGGIRDYNADRVTSHGAPASAPFGRRHRTDDSAI